MNEVSSKIIEVIDYLIDRGDYSSRRNFCKKNGWSINRIADVIRSNAGFKFEDIIQLKTILPELSIDWLFGFNDTMLQAGASMSSTNALLSYLDSELNKTKSDYATALKEVGKLQAQLEAVKKANALTTDAGCADVG